MKVCFGLAMVTWLLKYHFSSKLAYVAFCFQGWLPISAAESFASLTVQYEGYRRFVERRKFVRLKIYARKYCFRSNKPKFCGLPIFFEMYFLIKGIDFQLFLSLIRYTSLSNALSQTLSSSLLGPLSTDEIIIERGEEGSVFQTLILKLKVSTTHETWERRCYGHNSSVQ